MALMRDVKATQRGRLLLEDICSNHDDKWIDPTEPIRITSRRLFGIVSTTREYVRYVRWADLPQDLRKEFIENWELHTGTYENTLIIGQRSVDGGFDFVGVEEEYLPE